MIPAEAARTPDIEQVHVWKALAGLIALALERADLETRTAGSRTRVAVQLPLGAPRRLEVDLGAPRSIARAAISEAYAPRVREFELGLHLTWRSRHVRLEAEALEQPPLATDD